MTFPELLKSERKRLGLTQAQTAALLELSPRLYWSLEQGQKTPSRTLELGILAVLKQKR